MKRYAGAAVLVLAVWFIGTAFNAPWYVQGGICLVIGAIYNSAWERRKARSEPVEASKRSG